jgi:hypothetical protein
MCLLSAFILFVLFCVQVHALRRADPPSKGDQETEKATKAQERAAEP